VSGRDESANGRFTLRTVSSVGEAVLRDNLVGGLGPLRGLALELWLIVGLTLLLDPGVNCSGQIQPKHRVTVEDQETLKESLYMQLSPDGKMLVYVMGEEKGELWLVEAKAGSTPTELFEGTVPTWSPDSRHLAYYSSRSGTLQLWALDVASGRTEQVTNLLGGIDPDPWTRLNGWYYDPLRYSWSPDGTKLVFASQVIASSQKREEANKKTGTLGTTEKTAHPLVLTNDTPPEWTLQGVFRGEFGLHRVTGNVSETSSLVSAPSLPPRRVNQLFVVDVGSKRVTEITKDEQIYFNPDWSPDGRYIVCASSEGRSLVGDGSGTTNIYTIEVATTKKMALTTGAGDKKLPYWSPDGKWVAFYGGKHFAAQSVFVVSGQGGKASNITETLDRSVQEFYWSRDGDSIIFSYQDGVSWPIARIGAHNGRVDHVSDAEAAFRWPLTVARSGAIAWQQSDGSSRGVVRILPHDLPSSYVLLELNPQIKDWGLGTQEIVRWKNKRGDELEGILIKPVGYKTGQKYPLIVDCYPQLANGFKGESMSGNQALAARGYAVFFPNARGPHVWMNPFKNADFDQAAQGPKGWEVTFDDVMSGVDEIIQRGIADPDRMGLFGFSNGGAIVNYLLTKTGRFKCALSVAGALGADWPQLFFLTSPNPMIATIAGTTPWENPDAYIQLSSIYHLDKVTTPVLLADGDDDGLILLTDIEMYNGLRWFGKDVTFLRYPDQGHGFTGEAFKDFWERENAFFDKYLRPGN
jgi:dipeptidyl aminopeptidase/acylaminoacyl peptidase